MTSPGEGAGARLLARLAVLAAVGSLVVLVLSVGESGLEVLGAGLLGLVLGAAGVWWFLAHRGLPRLIGAVVVVAAPVGVLVLDSYDGLWRTALVLILCWGGAGLRRGRLAQGAARTAQATGRRASAEAAVPHHEPEVGRREGRVGLGKSSLQVRLRIGTH
ncbi:hypothetical protein [Streptomyces sp. NPDC056105]|uniref:hypothetical protein n=1 Tax=Streptomyces sp. NPDC056105 TaxID=3345714 RepID=UPI0035E0F938